jgi:hypothetical protein
MLNLRDLEKSLDEALAKETTESLTKWLESKRALNYYIDAFLSSGDLICLEEKHLQVQASVPFILRANTSSIDLDYTEDVLIAA